nr:uncharacterized protein LOC109618214 isoform X2 [Crassostrea gigas]
MAIRWIRIYVSAIQIFCVLINTDVFVSSVCLEDIFSFIRSSKACAFRKADFDNISNDETKRCQIGCSILSTVPLYSEMNNRNVYKMSGIKLSLLSFQYTNWLPTYCNDTTGLTINIGCGGKFISNRGIRESCVSDTQCENGTTNSMCNETSEVCECKKGYLFLWESNTCSPIKRETEQTKSSHTGTVMGVGVAGLVLGVVVCGILYFILIHYRKKYQTRYLVLIDRETMIWKDLVFTTIYIVNQSTVMYNQTMITSHNMAWVMTIVI